MGDQKPHRSVVIDDEDIDAYSPDYGDEDYDNESDQDSVVGEEHDGVGLLDEEEARLRMEQEILEATTQELMMHDYPSDCCPEGCYLKFPCIAGDPDSPFWQGWGNLRIKTFRLIENKYFETAVITMILISSLALVSNDNLGTVECFAW